MARKSTISPERAALPCLILFYLAIVLGQSAHKIIWGDELFTLYIAQQPGPAGIWHALVAGADPNPPLIHILVKLATSVFGVGPEAIRLPSILCVLLAIVAMWTMLRRWVTVPFAVVGTLAFMATRGFDYSYDARSYAPMMGFGMVSLALWMKTGDWSSGRRLAAVAGMAVALGLGISSNYYCVLAFFPIATGEMLRSWRARRVRVDVWLGLLLGALPLIAYLPLVRHNIAEFGPHAWNRPQISMVGFSYLELVESIFWPVLAMGLFAVWKCRAGWTMPAPEAAAVGVLLVYPMIGFLVAISGAGMISPRCVAPVCCGFGLAAGVLTQYLFAGRRWAGRALVVLMLVWVASREGACAFLLEEQRISFFALRDRIADEPAGPILVGDSSFVLPLYFYSAPSVQGRIVFPIDFKAIHAYECDDSGEQNLWAGRYGVFPFPVVPFSETTFKGGPLVVIGRPTGWLAQSVEGQGISLRVDDPDSKPWHGAFYGVGGVLSPLAHPESRILVHDTAR